MHISTVLRAPRYASAAEGRRVAGGLFLLLVAIGLITTILTHAAFALLLMYVAGLVALWWGWLSSLLILARDGRRLHLPGSVRSNVAALCLYALAGVAAPVVIAGISGTNLAIAALAPALATGGTLAWLLLPYWLSLAACFLPALYVGLQGSLHMPVPKTTQLTAWGWPLMAILIVICMVRGYAFVHGRTYQNAGSRPMLVSGWRATLRQPIWSPERHWLLRRIRGRKLETDFRGIGNGDPMRSIRVALGDWYVPQTWHGRSTMFVGLLLPLLLIAVLVSLGNGAETEAPRKLALAIGTYACLWLGVFGALMAALLTIGQVQRRWRSGADLAVLALLPGIGAGASVAGATARAALCGPAAALALLWLIGLAGVALSAAATFAFVLLTLFEAALVALMLMGTLHILAGLPVRLPEKLLTITAWAVLGIASFVLAATSPPGPWSATAEGLGTLCALAWVALIAWTLRRALRAWRALQRQPHPFLGAGQ